jgi:hypothetical protein
MNAEYAFDGVRERATVEDARRGTGMPSRVRPGARRPASPSSTARWSAVTQRDWIDATDGSARVPHRGAGRSRLAPARHRHDAACRERALIRARWRRARDRSAAGDRHVRCQTRRRRRLALRVRLRAGALVLPRWSAPASMLRAGDPAPARRTGAAPGHAADRSAVWEADLDAFRDHWGGWDRPRRASGAGSSRRSSARPVPRCLGRRRGRRGGAQRDLPRRTRRWASAWLARQRLHAPRVAGPRARPALIVRSLHLLARARGWRRRPSASTPTTRRAPRPVRVGGFVVVRARGRWRSRWRPGR